MNYNEYQYRLDKGSKKLPCPECLKRTLVRYVDHETGEYLPSHYGRCDRETNCNYHLNPYKDGFGKTYGNAETSSIPGIWKNTNNCLKLLNNNRFENIPIEILKQTLSLEGYDQNVFIQNLLHHIAFPFDLKDIEKIIVQYNLGTVCNGYRTGAITFPYIDIQNQVRTIQVKQFDQNNHTTGTDFLHSIIEKHHRRNNKEIPDWLKAYLKNEKIVSCLFGENLASKYPLNPIALVEAPKTAIYGTLYFGFPDNPVNLLWMAVYNLSSLSYEKCKVLKDRRVYLFPDLSKNGKAFEIWTMKAKELQERIPGIRIKVSDLLEINGEEAERSDGLDLGDYLIKLDWRKFRSRYEKPESEKFQEEQIIPIPESETIPDLISENGEKSEVPATNYFCDSIPAYLDNKGRLLIETPFGKTFTTYPSIDHYNQRICLPIFIDKNEIDLALIKEVRINLNSLSINT
ncbi:MAG: hypothetical protein IPL31_17570 [Saprospiraceae bacterium]|nr:hypothetical protein [Saprospiraceae bacterium]